MNHAFIKVHEVYTENDKHYSLSVYERSKRWTFHTMREWVALFMQNTWKFLVGDEKAVEEAAS